MGQFTALNDEQAGWVREIGADPREFSLILDNEQCMVLMHMKSRNELMLYKNRRVKRGNQ